MKKNSVTRRLIGWVLLAIFGLAVTAIGVILFKNGITKNLPQVWAPLQEVSNWMNAYGIVLGPACMVVGLGTCIEAIWG